MNVTLQRIERRGNTVTGSLTVSNGGFRIRFACATLERADRLIQAGTYALKWTRSPKFSRAATIKKGFPMDIYTPEILGVASRSGLRIHVANYTRQLEGCIAPGFSFTDLDKDGTIDIAESTKAYDALVDCLLTRGLRDSAEGFRITIRDPRK